jgi:hypothetical protein
MLLERGQKLEQKADSGQRVKLNCSVLQLQVNPSTREGGKGRRYRTREKRGLAERLLGEGADVARGVERGRQALHQPPLVAVRLHLNRRRR